MTMTTETHMARQLTVNMLGEFTAWCRESRGDYAVEAKIQPVASLHLAFGAGDGTTWELDGSDSGLLTASLRAAVQSGVQWWAHDASVVASAIHTSTGLRLRGLLCTLVLSSVVEPEHITSGGVSLRASDPAARAVECARRVATTREATPKKVRGIAVRECKVDDLWRWAAVRGYRVDTKMLSEEVTHLERLRFESLRDHGVDLTRDTDDVRRWLVTRGIHVTDATGKPTLSHKAYYRVVPPPAAADDWRIFVALREAAKISGKLTEIQTATTPAGRVHPMIRGIGAVTGRTAIGGPALQNLPARLRGMLLAEPGMVLVSCDLDRVEPRVVAAVSGDPALRKAVQRDVYAELAVSVWGENARHDESRRGIAKTAFLAMLYGQGAAALAAALGVTMETARDVTKGLLTAYPVMAQWMKDVRRRAEDGESLQTVRGRPLPSTPEAPYRAVNWVVQGSAADQFKEITLGAAELLGRDALWLPLHDELIVQVREGDAEEAARVLREVMTTELNGVGMSGSPVVLGTRWGTIQTPKPTAADAATTTHTAVDGLGKPGRDHKCLTCGKGSINVYGTWSCPCGDF